MHEFFFEIRTSVIKVASAIFSDFAVFWIVSILGLNNLSELIRNIFFAIICIIVAITAEEILERL